MKMKRTTIILTILIVALLIGFFYLQWRRNQQPTTNSTVQTPVLSEIPAANDATFSTESDLEIENPALETDCSTAAFVYYDTLTQRWQNNDSQNLDYFLLAGSAAYNDQLAVFQQQTALAQPLEVYVESLGEQQLDGDECMININLKITDPATGGLSQENLRLQLTTNNDAQAYQIFQITPLD
ncbi:MAG: hypothetical protein Q4G02_01525 [bacterium]|nr:hypothetical protein [bacterium]